MLVGLDVGTSGLKAIATDDAGRIVASASVEYPLYIPQPGWAEQDGNDFTSAAERTLGTLAAKLGARARDVRSIGLSGQMHTAMLIGGDGQLVRRAILWCDGRTSDACRSITERIGRARLASTLGNAALEGFTLPKLVWLAEHEPEVLALVRRVVMPKDWVACHLTGELGTEASDASGTLAFEPGTRRWAAALLGELGIDVGLFPDCGDSWGAAGRLHPELAERTGLPPKIPVARGAADNAAGAVGLGVVRPGIGMVSLGTSGVVLVPTDAFTVDPELRLHTFCHAAPDAWYLMGVMLSAGGALRWWRDLFGGALDYEQLLEEASTAPLGARGVTFLPYLMGERTPHADADARAALVGMSAATTRAELSRAVVEGISYGLGDSLDLMRSLEPQPAIRELRITGGGAKSAFWRGLLADLFGVPIAVPSSTEGPALGAAILGGVAAGAFNDVAEAADAIVSVSERVEPNAARHAQHRENHASYRELYRELRERFRESARRSLG